MIATKRLVLRAAQAEDLNPLHSIFSDPVAMRYWDRPAYSNIADTQSFLTHFMSQDLESREEYILERNGICIGKAGMWQRFEIGYILHPDYWGQGLIVEAMQAILPRIWARFPNADKLTAETDPRNIASARVLAKLGFEQVGLIEKNFLYGESEWCDTAYFETKRPETKRPADKTG